MDDGAVSDRVRDGGDAGVRGGTSRWGNLKSVARQGDLFAGAIGEAFDQFGDGGFARLR